MINMCFNIDLKYIFVDSISFIQKGQRNWWKLHCHRWKSREEKCNAENEYKGFWQFAHRLKHNKKGRPIWKCNTVTYNSLKLYRSWEGLWKDERKSKKLRMRLKGPQTWSGSFWDPQTIIHPIQANQIPLSFWIFIKTYSTLHMC